MKTTIAGPVRESDPGMKPRTIIVRDKTILRHLLVVIEELDLEEPKQVVISDFVEIRSDKQHGYYRVLVGICSRHSGYETSEVHDLFRDIAGLFTIINKREVLKSTNKMNVKEMNELIEVAIRTASKDWELILPPPIYTASL